MSVLLGNILPAKNVLSVNFILEKSQCQLLNVVTHFLNFYISCYFGLGENYNDPERDINFP